MSIAQGPPNPKELNEILPGGMLLSQEWRQWHDTTTGLAVWFPKLPRPPSKWLIEYPYKTGIGGFTCALANIYGDGGIIKEINEYTPSVVDPGRFMSALASLNEERTQESIDNWKSRFFFVQLSRSSANTPLYEYYPRQPKLFVPRLTEHDVGNANVHVFMNGKIIFSDKFEDVETTDATLQNLQGWEPRSIDQKNKLLCLSFTEKEGHLASLTGDDMFAEGLVRVEIFVTPVRWEAWSSFSEPTWSPFNPGHLAHFRWNFLTDDLLIKFGMKPQYAFFSETVIPDHIASLCKATRELSIRDPRL